MTIRLRDFAALLMPGQTNKTVVRTLTKTMTAQTFRAVFLFIVLMLATCQVAVSQGPGGRPTPTPTPRSPTTSVRKTTGTKNPAPLPKPADITVTVSPDCKVWLNESEVPLQTTLKAIQIDRQRVMTTYLSGKLTIKNLKAGSYRLRGGKPDYYEYSESLELKSGQTHYAVIDLKPIPGTLTIKPTVEGTELELWQSESNTRLGRYVSQLERVEVLPGRYRIKISKEGYYSGERDVAVKAGEAVYLEPAIERLPPPAPTSPRPPQIPKIATSLSAVNDGKFTIVNIRSSSGDFTRRVGTVSVRYSSIAGNAVEGTFNGMPCQVEFIKLENVAEGAIVESPSPSNQWAKVVVRVRPKDSKRPINFAINWRSVGTEMAQTYSDPAPSPIPDSFVPAEAIEKVKPTFPRAAKNSVTTGVVTVFLVIDRYGLVTSAKAPDGPFVFRQVSEEAARKWKFRPATRNGNPVDSELSITFNFKN